MSSRRPLVTATLCLVVAVVLAACGQATESDLMAAEEKWSATGTDDYDLDMEISCFCPLTGSYEVSVRDGQVAEILYLVDGTSIEPPDWITPADFTVEGLFEVVRENLDADKIKVKYDGVQGYPTSIDIYLDTAETDNGLVISAVLQAS